MLAESQACLPTYFTEHFFFEVAESDFGFGEGPSLLQNICSWVDARDGRSWAIGGLDPKLFQMAFWSVRCPRPCRLSR